MTRVAGSLADAARRCASVLDLEREVRDLKEANEILKATSSTAATYRVCVSAQGRHRRPDQVVQSSPERYLLELWEQHPAPFAVLRSKNWTTDEVTNHIA